MSSPLGRTASLPTFGDGFRFNQLPYTGLKDPGCDRPIFRVRLFLSGFEEKLDIWKSNSMLNLVNFWEILTNRRRKLLKNSHEIRLFIHLFSHNLGGKSCKSLVWKRSPLDSALWRKNCSLKTRKQPLFWDNSNKNVKTRHLQRARKLDKMSSNRTQIIGLSHPGYDDD